MKFLQGIFASWATTVLGASIIVEAVGSVGRQLLDGDPNTNPNWAVIMLAIQTGIGLILAKDAWKSTPHK